MITATIYRRPTGDVKEVDVVNIRESDALFFKHHDLKISMEMIDNDEIIVYACPRRDLSEESEVMVFSNTARSCEDTMAELAQVCRDTYGYK